MLGFPILMTKCRHKAYTRTVDPFPLLATPMTQIHIRGRHRPRTTPSRMRRYTIMPRVARRSFGIG